MPNIREKFFGKPNEPSFETEMDRSFSEKTGQVEKKIEQNNEAKANKMSVFNVTMSHDEKSVFDLTFSHVKMTVFNVTMSHDEKSVFDLTFSHVKITVFNVTMSHDELSNFCSFSNHQKHLED